MLYRVRKLGRIALDPCSNLDNSTWAGVCYSGPDGNGMDGLKESWFDAVQASCALHDYDDGLAFVNYPYSDSTAWAEKWVAEAARGTKIIVLAPARPDTAWWRSAVAVSSSAVAFWRGRITFDLPPGVQTYKLLIDSDPRAACQELLEISGVLVAKPAKKHIHIEARRDVVGADLLAAGAVEVNVSPSPFPSALLFYNFKLYDVQEAFDDAADLYLPIRVAS